MDLIALAKNPVPSGATTGYFDCPGRIKLRFARWTATRGPERGTVCLFQGRGEFIEKYFEVVADLRRRGFGVATMDWRGQGGSSRMLSNPNKGFVRSFADFDQDLAYFMKEVVLPNCAPPYIAVAHSMGGHILLRNASQPKSWFSRMVLSAPMIAIDQTRLGASPGVARDVCRGACRPSALDRPTCATARTGRSSSSPSRATCSPRIATAICATSRCWRKRRSSASARRPSPGCARPIAPCRGCDRPTIRTAWRCRCCMFAAGMDQVVSTQAIEEFALRLKVGTHVLIPQARHEILQETDEIRQRFWAAFDAYMGADAPAG